MLKAVIKKAVGSINSCRNTGGIRMEVGDSRRPLLFLAAFLASLSASHAAVTAESPPFIPQTRADMPASRETGIQAYNFDFDDNIFSTGARIYLTNTKTGHKKGVSTAYWAVVRQKLGKEDEWKDYVLDTKTGLAEFDDSGPAGAGLFKTQIENALKDRTEKWKAPGWNAFCAAMRDPEKRRHTTIITARSHSPEAILKGLQVLKEKGLIGEVPKKENIYTVSWPGLPRQFKGADTAESKAKVMAYLLNELDKMPVPEKSPLAANREGDGLERMHLWDFSDDDFGDYMTAFCALSSEVADGRWPHIKIMIFHTGKYPAVNIPRSAECAKLYGPITDKSANFNLVITPKGKPRALNKSEGVFFKRKTGGGAAKAGTRPSRIKTKEFKRALNK
ncbi:MAG: hypothetical protein KKH28_12480 [Elusimicrobia bacterium]|nr:hypothetical protein [Elusimicrobiota bacterium]